MKWGKEVDCFLDKIYQDGIHMGRLLEHKSKMKTCKYFRHKGGTLWSDGCEKLQDLCTIEDCPSEKEPFISVRD